MKSKAPHIYLYVPILAIVLLFFWAGISIAAARHLKIDYDADPSLLPYTIHEKHVNQFSERQQAVGNFVQVYRPLTPESDSAYIIRAFNGDPTTGAPASILLIDSRTNTIIDQDPLMMTLSEYTLFDDPATGRKSIMAFGYVDDSAYAVKIAPFDESVQWIYLAGGKDHNGDGIWRGPTHFCLRDDYDYDGVEEIFAQVCPGRDIEPRVLFCIDPVAMKIEWSLPVAGSVNEGNIFSCNDSLDPAVVLTAYNFKNGTVDKNFNDLFSYLARVNSRGQVEYKRVLSVEHGAEGIWPALDDSTFFVYHGLPMVTEDSLSDEIVHHYQISRIDRHCKILERYDIPGRLTSLWYGDFDNDGQADIYTLFADGVVRIYDTLFNAKAESSPTNISSFMDSTYLPGLKQPVYILNTALGAEFYSYRFEKLAQIPGKYFRIHPTAYNAAGKPHTFVVSWDNFDKTVELTRKSFGQYASILFYKYQNGILLALTLLAFALVVVNAVRMRTARRLMQRERQLQSVFKNAQDAFYRTTMDGKIEWASESALRLFGFENEKAVMGLSVLDLYGNKEEREVLVNMLLKKGRINDFQISMKRRDGSTIIVSVNAYLTYDQDGNPAKIEGIARDITTRVTAEEKLRASEEKYRTLVESAGEAIFSINRGGTLLFLNEIAARRLGGNPEDFVGKEIHDVFPKEIGERHYRNIVKVMDSKTGTVFDSSTVLRGRELQYRTSIQPIFNERGEVDSVLGIGRDITEITETKTKLKSEQIFVRSLLDTANSLILCLDKDCRITVFNSELERVTGYSRDEVLGKNWEDIFVPERHQRDKTPFVDWVRIHPKDTYEREILTKSGEERLILWSNSALFYPETDDFVAIAVGIDVTERKKIEKEAERAHFELRQIFNAAAPMCVIDLNYNIIRINETYSKLYKRTEEDEVGRKCYKQWPGPLCRTKRCPLAKILQGRDKYVYEWDTRLEDGRRIAALVTAVPYRGSDGKIEGIVETFADITERKKAEEILRETRARFRQALQNSQDIMYRYDFVEDTYDYMSNSVERVLGYAPADMLEYLNSHERGIRDFIHPDDLPKFDAHAEKFPMGLPGSHDLRYIEYRFKCKDGRWRWLSDSHSVVPDISGKPRYLIGSARDVTEQHEAEDLLRESEAFNRAIIEHSPIGVSIRSRSGQLLGYNEAWKTIWAMGDEDLEKDIKTSRTTLQFDQRDRYLSDWSDRVREIYENGGYLFIPEVKSTNHRSGKTRWMSQHFYAIKDEKTGAVDRVIIMTEDITDRKVADQVIAESEHRFRVIAKATPIPMAITSFPEGKILYTNDLLAPAFGYPKDEIDKINAEVLYHDPEDRRKIAKILKEKGFLSNYELKGIKKDGSEFWAILTLQSIVFKGQKAVLGGFVDITERKKTEEALRVSEERFRELADLLPQTVFELDIEGNVLYANRKALEEFGYSAGDVERGINISSLFSEDDYELVQANMQRQIDGHDVRGFEYIAVRKNGSTFPIIAHSAIIYKDGTPVGLRGIAINITERKRAERALIESEQKFRNLAEHSIQAMFVVQKGTIVYANRRLAEIGETTLDDIIDRGLKELLANLIDPGDRFRFYHDYLRRLRRRYPIRRFELKIKSPSGSTKWIEVLTGNITFEGSPAIMFTLIDITDRVKAIEHMRSADQYKFEMAKRTAGVFAHEIRNALFPASIVLPKLKEQGNGNHLDDDKISEFAGIAERAVRRAGEITKFITRYTKLDSEIQPETVRLSAVIGEIVNHNQFRIKEGGIKIELSGKTGLKVISNRNQLIMALNNFLVNSLDALTGCNNPYILIEWDRLDNMVSIGITDNGCGISEANINRVFEPFFSTKSERGGTGIGLAMAKRIIEMYGGLVSVDSENNRGTKFTIKMVAPESSGNRVS